MFATPKENILPLKYFIQKQLLTVQKLLVTKCMPQFIVKGHSNFSFFPDRNSATKIIFYIQNITISA